MIICSCNKVSTEELRSAARYVKDPNPKLLLNMVGWSGNCSICAHQVVEKCHKAMQEAMNELPD